jgi:hypothetical protein
VFGNTLQSELDEVEGKKKKDIKRKRQVIFDRWFPEAREKRKFADPGRR